MAAAAAAAATVNPSPATGTATATTSTATPPQPAPDATSIPPPSEPTCPPPATTPSGTYHGRPRFDPLLILSQIILLQATFYTSYTVLLLFFHRATGTTPRATIPDQIFNHNHLTLSHFPGWVSATSLLVAALGPTAVAFASLVGRSKRALDFASTLFISHLVGVCIHSGFPTSVVWWILNIFAAAGLATIAEALSLRVELRAIAVGGTSAGVHPTSASTGQQSSGKGMQPR